jgi:hypothetical protein
VNCPLNLAGVRGVGSVGSMCPFPSRVGAWTAKWESPVVRGVGSVGSMCPFPSREGA